MENIAIKAGRKLFSQHVKDYTPQDPLYETYTDKRGRQRRRKACVFLLCLSYSNSLTLIIKQRELPLGLTNRDAKILKAVKVRAHYLDKGFKVGPMRFGWTFIVGASSCFSCYRRQE